MRKIFTDHIITEDEFVLEGTEHNHVSVVLRYRRGDELTLCNGDGFDYLFTVKDIDRNQTTLSFLEKRPSTGEPRVKVDLYVAIPKADRLELIVQKCTELGISSVTPFLSDNVAVKDANIRIDRLNKIAKEAAEQCGRGAVPAVNPPITMGDVLKKTPLYNNPLFFYEKGGKPLKTAITRKGSTALITGCEGGFSAFEGDALIRAGWRPVSLGKRILRAETAGIVAAALAMYELGELQ